MSIDYRVLPITLINKYVWELASGGVEGVNHIPLSVWDVSLYSDRRGRVVDIENNGIGMPLKYIYSSDPGSMPINAGDCVMIEGLSPDIFNKNKGTVLESYTGSITIENDSIDESIQATDTSGRIWSPYCTPPIFPIHENQGNIDSSDKPYILYDYLFEETPGTMYEVRKERAIYTIVASSPGQLYSIKNFIQDNLNKLDTTAQSINRHVNNDSIRFKTVRCSQELFVMQELKQTERSFSPRFASTLVITYEYTRS